MSGCSLKEAPCFKRLLKPSSPQTEGGTRIYLYLKMLGKLSASCTAPVNTWLRYFHKSQIGPKTEYCCHVWNGVPQPSLDRVQKRFAEFLVIIFHSTIRIPQKKCHKPSMGSDELHAFTLQLRPSMPRTLEEIIPIPVLIR